MTSEPRRFSLPLPRPLWIGLATVVLVVAALGFQFGLPIYRQKLAIREIERLGGTVETQLGVPEWAWRLLGDDRTRILDDVFYVRLFPTDLSDNELRQLSPHLRSLKTLRQLVLIDTRITDAGIFELTSLTGLELLYLGKVNVTDAGVVHLAPLTNLKVLDLSETGVTDAGLEYLKGCVAIQVLQLERTDVTDTGLRHLARLTRLEVLWLTGTRVTDAGLKQLKGMTHLAQLWLGDTAVTDAGVAELQCALPDMTIER